METLKKRKKTVRQSVREAMKCSMAFCNNGTNMISGNPCSLCNGMGYIPKRRIIWTKNKF